MLTAGRKVQERDGVQFGYPAPAGGFAGFQGSLAMMSAGVLLPTAALATAALATAAKVVGIVERIPPIDPSLAQQRIPVRRGTFLFLNSAAGDAITLSAIGQAAYAVDDQTVALTSSNNLRPAAGTIVDVESDGVWVRVG